MAALYIDNVWPFFVHKICSFLYACIWFIGYSSKHLKKMNWVKNMQNTIKCMLPSRRRRQPSSENVYYMMHSNLSDAEVAFDEHLLIFMKKMCQMCVGCYYHYYYATWRVFVCKFVIRFGMKIKTMSSVKLGSIVCVNAWQLVSNLSSFNEEPCNVNLMYVSFCACRKSHLGKSNQTDRHTGVVAVFWCTCLPLKPFDSIPNIWMFFFLSICFTF